MREGVQSTPRLSTSLVHLGVAHLLAKGCFFAATIFLARRLSKTDFGEVVVAQNVAIFLVIFTDLGLRPLGMRDVARRSDVPDRNSRAAYGLMLSLGGVMCVAIIACALLFASGSLAQLLALFGGTTLAMAAYPDWAFKGRMKTARLVGAESIKGLVYLLPLVLLVHDSGRLFLVPILYFAGYGAATAFLWISGRRWLPRPLLERTSVRAVLAEALPLGVSGIAVQSTYYTGTFFLQILAGPAAVAYFSVPQKVTLLLYGLMAITGEVLIPRFTTALTEGLAAAGALLQSAVKALFAGGVLLLVGSLFLARPFLTSVFGDQYSGSVYVQQLLLTGFVIFVLGSPCIYFLVAIGDVRAVMRAGLLGGAVNLAASSALIPLLQEMGAAFATIATEVAITAVVVRRAHRVLADGQGGTDADIGKPKALR